MVRTVPCIFIYMLWTSYEKIFMENQRKFLEPIHHPLPSAMYHPASVRDNKKISGQERTITSPKNIIKKLLLGEDIKQRETHLLFNRWSQEDPGIGDIKILGVKKGQLPSQKWNPKNFFWGKKLKRKRLKWDPIGYHYVWSRHGGLTQEKRRRAWTHVGFCEVTTHGKAFSFWFFFSSFLFSFLFSLFFSFSFPFSSSPLHFFSFCFFVLFFFFLSFYLLSFFKV